MWSRDVAPVGSLQELKVTYACLAQRDGELNASLMAGASLLLALVLALAAVGAAAVFNELNDRRRRWHLAARDKLRHTQRLSASRSPSGRLEFTQIRSEFFSNPSKNAGWKIVLPEDFAVSNVGLSRVMQPADDFRAVCEDP